MNTLYRRITLTAYILQLTVLICFFPRPLNPVLGECVLFSVLKARTNNTQLRLFYGTWPSTSTTLLVEQVSHHPPITAYRIENKTKGLVLTGHNAQKTSFSGQLHPFRPAVLYTNRALLTWIQPEAS